MVWTNQLPHKYISGAVHLRSGIELNQTRTAWSPTPLTTVICQTTIKHFIFSESDSRSSLSAFDCANPTLTPWSNFSVSYLSVVRPICRQQVLVRSLFTRRPFVTFAYKPTDNMVLPRLRPPTTSEDHSKCSNSLRYSSQYCLGSRLYLRLRALLCEVEPNTPTRLWAPRHTLSN
jgi:hypothetical protein